MTQTDRELLEAFLAGDVAAFEALYTRRKGSTFSVIRKLLPAAEAEEVHQDVWLKVIEGKALPAADYFERWILQTARHAALDRCRRNRSQAQRTQDAERASPGYTEETCSDSLLARKLARVLDKLKPEQRQLILAQTIEGHSYAEIAGALGIPVQKVTSRLHEARRQCHRLLEPVRRELGIKPRRPPLEPSPEAQESSDRST